MLLNSLPFTFLRPVFIYMFYRLYRGKSTRKRVLVVGIISEVFVEAIFYFTMIMQLLLYPYGWFPLNIVFPIPILLVIGLVYMKLVPPPEVTSWVDESEPSHWWTEKEKDKPEERLEEKPEEVDEKETDEKPEKKSEVQEEEIEEKKDSDIWMD